MVFNAEQHFEAKIRRGSIKNQSTILNFDTRPFEGKKTEREKGLRRICRDRFSFQDFEKINEMHCEYLRELKGNLGPKAFLTHLYKAELTGARIKIAGKVGIIAEERKNAICVVFETGGPKIYPKKTWDFSLIFEGVEYLFMSEALRANRKVSG